MGEIMPVGWLGRLVGGLTGLAGWCLYSEPLLDCTRTEKPYIPSFSFICFSTRKRRNNVRAVKKDVEPTAAAAASATVC